MVNIKTYFFINIYFNINHILIDLSANCNRYEGNFSHGLKHGEGVYYHIDKGQEVRGIWVEDLPRCVCITDLEYRQTSVQSTKYPIPKVRFFLRCLY